MKDGVLALWVYVLLGIPLIAVLSYVRNKKHSEKKRKKKTTKEIHESNLDESKIQENLNICLLTVFRGS